jgi:hypothetical protein
MVDGHFDTAPGGARLSGLDNGTGGESRRPSPTHSHSSGNDESHTAGQPAGAKKLIAIYVKKGIVLGKYFLILADMDAKRIHLSMDIITCNPVLPVACRHVDLGAIAPARAIRSRSTTCRQPPPVPGPMIFPADGNRMASRLV